MKKIVFIFSLAAIITLCIITIIIGSHGTVFQSADTVLFLALSSLILSFIIFKGFKNLQSFRNNEPSDDEFSKKQKTKASSVAFWISLFYWFVLIFISDKIKTDPFIFTYSGFLGMILIFVICSIVISKRGLRNE